MKLTVLQKALQHYIISNDASSADKQEAFKALESIAIVSGRYTDKDLFDNQVFVVTLSAISDMLNILTYDTYGQYAKACGDSKVSFKSYVGICRRNVPEIEAFTEEMFEIGYAIISDLWSDNEQLGQNNPDGTFNKDYYTEGLFDTMSIAEVNDLLDVLDYTTAVIPYTANTNPEIEIPDTRAIIDLKRKFQDVVTMNITTIKVQE